MLAYAVVANEGLEPPRALLLITTLPGSKDVPNGSTKGAMILIQQDPGRARRDGISQGDERLGVQRVAARPAVELLPGTGPQTARCECLQEKPDHFAPAMAMDFRA